VGQRVKYTLSTIRKKNKDADITKAVLTGDALASTDTYKALRSTLEANLGEGLWVNQSEPAIAASVGAARFANKERLMVVVFVRIAIC
jgi:hypothetical protein